VKIQKNVTTKVLAANQNNSKSSTGPRSTAGKAAASLNAVTHGLLANQAVFQDDSEQAEFRALLHEVRADLVPVGFLERMLTEEICISYWKLQKTQGWEIEEIRNRRKAAKALLLSVAKNCDAACLPLFTNDHGSLSAAGLGWDCSELLVHTGTTSSEQEENEKGSEKNGKSDRMQVVAKLHTSMENILRYQTNLKRDLYRGIATLRDLQAARRSESSARFNDAKTSARGGDDDPTR
jgi:hypothetical protein